MNDLELLILERSFGEEPYFPIYCFLDPIHFCNSSIETDEESVAIAFTQLRADGIVTLFESTREYQKVLSDDYDVLKGLKDRSRVIYGLTQKGFDLWEGVTKPNWSKIVIPSLGLALLNATLAGGHEMTHSIQGVDRPFLEDYLNCFVKTGVVIEESTMKWEEFGSWRPFPFKELPSGWCATFDCIFSSDDGSEFMDLLYLDNEWLVRGS